MAEFPKLDGKFKLEKYSGVLSGYHEWMYVVCFDGKFSHVLCDYRIRLHDDALKHFWRWIGAM